MYTKVLNQECLVSKIFKQDYCAHNAVADVESLQRLFIVSNVRPDIIFRNSISIDSVIKIKQFKQKNQVNVASLQDLDINEVISKAMIEKIACSPKTAVQ